MSHYPKPGRGQGPVYQYWPGHTAESDAIEGWWMQPRVGDEYGGGITDVCIGSVTSVEPAIEVRYWGLHMGTTVAVAALEFAPRSPNTRLWRVRCWGDYDADLLRGCTAFEFRQYLGCIDISVCWRKWACDVVLRRLRKRDWFSECHSRLFIAELLERGTDVSELELQRILRYVLRARRRNYACMLPFGNAASVAVSNVLRWSDVIMTPDNDLEALESLCLTELQQQDQERYRTPTGYLTEDEKVSYRALTSQPT